MGFDLSVKCSIEFGSVIDHPQFLHMIRHSVKYILEKNPIPDGYDIYGMHVTWDDMREWVLSSRHVDQDAITMDDEDGYDVYDCNADHDLLDYFFSADGPMSKALVELDPSGGPGSQSEPRLKFEYSQGRNCWSCDDPVCSEQLRIIVDNPTTNVRWERGAHHADDDLPWGVRATRVKTVKKGLRLADELDVPLEPPAAMTDAEKRRAKEKILRFAKAFRVNLETQPGLMFVSCVCGG